MAILLVISVAIVGALSIALGRVRRREAANAVVLGVAAQLPFAHERWTDSRDTPTSRRLVYMEKSLWARRIVQRPAEDPDPTDEESDPPSGSGSAAAAMVDARLQPRVYPRRRPERS